MTAVAYVVLLPFLLVGFSPGTAFTVSPYADVSACAGFVRVRPPAGICIEDVSLAGVDFSGGARTALQSGGMAGTLQCDLVNLRRTFVHPSMLAFVLAAGVSKTFGVTTAEAAMLYARTLGISHRCVGAYARLSVSRNRLQTSLFASPLVEGVDVKDKQLRAGLELASRIGAFAPHGGVGLVLHHESIGSGPLLAQPFAMVGVQLAPLEIVSVLASQMAAPKKISIWN